MFTYLFHDLYNLDDNFKGIHDRVPKISGIPSQYIQKIGFHTEITDEIKENIDNKKTPIYKLTYKFDNGDVKELDSYDKKLILYYLYSTID